jgi:aminotransferase
MPNTANRLNHITASAISEMMDFARQVGAISLVEGRPDFEPPEELVRAAEQALRVEEYQQYAVSYGSPRFRQALARKQSHFMGLALDPETDITVTCGGTEAVLAALLAVCNPGDKIITFSPFYESYGPGSLISGSELTYVPLRPPTFDFDPDELRRAFQQGAKAIILCNPSNPLGKVFSPDELQTIAYFAQEFDAFVIADEVYEHIVYAPHRHTYIASLPGMFERTISCSSLSKTYAITGWRLGYAIAPEPVTQRIRKLHDFLTIGAPAPLQEAAVTALNFPNDYYEKMQSEYSALKDRFLGHLRQCGLGFIEPQGAYYVMLDISLFGFSNDYEFCRWMAKEIGVAGVPGSYFFHDPVNQYVRLNFAKRVETLDEAGERLRRLKVGTFERLNVRRLQI